MKTQGFTPSVVLDVGAARGDWTASCLRVFPDAHYLMFEPLPAYREELQGLVGPRVEHRAVAVGRTPGTMPILIGSQIGGSSFLPSSRGDSYFIGSKSVTVVALDDLDLSPEHALVKLDVQGYELEVLAGAENLLTHTEVVIAEKSIYPYLTDQPLTHEVVAYMTARGFRVYDTADEWRLPSGVLAGLDLVFVAKDSALLSQRWWD
jgi:FkbM family methyltransferase